MLELFYEEKTMNIYIWFTRKQHNNYTHSISSRRRVMNIFSSKDEKYLCLDEEN